MKNLIARIILPLCVLLLVYACSGRGIDIQGPENQLVMIKAPAGCAFNIPGLSSLTKAGGGSGGFDELFIKSDRNLGALKNMAKGSTMWLLIEVPDDYQYKEEYSDPSEVVEPVKWVESEYSYKPYVVGDNGAMYPCETKDSTAYDSEGKKSVYRVVSRDSEGKILSSGSALMLTPGLYRFHAVSPASALLTEYDNVPQNPTVHVDNGKYVQATDVRWKQSYPKGILIQGGTQTSGVQSIRLAALVNQTARIKVNIRCGDNHVRRLALQKSGIEISGIQQNIYGHFQWTMDGDTIKTRIGNKYEGLKFHEFEEKKDTDGRDMITAYASILPTDARTNTIYVLLHLIVNNVPTQYMVGLTNQLYEAANEYEFNFRVRMDGNVTVGTWDNNTIIYPDVELSSHE